MSAMPRLLYTERVPPAMHARLENWGACMRPRRKPGLSATGQICHDMALRAGQTRGVEVSMPRRLDANDARIIEAYWRACAYRLVPNHRALLRSHYVAQARPEATCRVLAIPQRRYDDELLAAVDEFQHFMSWAKVTTT